MYCADRVPEKTYKSVINWSNFVLLMMVIKRLALKVEFDGFGYNVGKPQYQYSEIGNFQLSFSLDYSQIESLFSNLSSLFYGRFSSVLTL